MKKAVRNSHFCGKSIQDREMQVQSPQVSVSMECLVKKKACTTEIKPIRVAGPQDDGREAANSFIGNNKDLRTYSQCYSKSVKTEF